MIPYSDATGPGRSTPFVNIALILVNLAVFGYELYLGWVGHLNQFYMACSEIPCELYQRCGNAPGAPYLIYLTTLTAMFMHAGWLHILGNMLLLWVFSDNVEKALGHV